jgi:hypothetical protein
MRLFLTILALGLVSCGQSDPAGQTVAGDAEANLEAENFDQDAMVDSGADTNTAGPLESQR